MPQEGRARPLHLRDLMAGSSIEVSPLLKMVGEGPKLPSPVGAFAGPPALPTSGGAGHIEAGVDAPAKMRRGGRGGSTPGSIATAGGPRPPAHCSRNRLLLLLHRLHLFRLLLRLLLRVIGRERRFVVVVVVVVHVDVVVVAAVVVRRSVREKHCQ